MLLAPAAWYESVPGAALSGSFNGHFIMTGGLAFIASGIALSWGSRPGQRAAGLALAGSIFPALHAGLHLIQWFTVGLPRGVDASFSEFVTIGLVAVLGLIFAGLRQKP